jgi:hypothetical protein
MRRLGAAVKGEAARCASHQPVPPPAPNNETELCIEHHAAQVQESRRRERASVGALMQVSRDTRPIVLCYREAHM